MEPTNAAHYLAEAALAVGLYLLQARTEEAAKLETRVRLLETKTEVTDTKLTGLSDAIDRLDHKLDRIGEKLDELKR